MIPASSLERIFSQCTAILNDYTFFPNACTSSPLLQFQLIIFLLPVRLYPISLQQFLIYFPQLLLCLQLAYSSLQFLLIFLPILKTCLRHICHFLCGLTSKNYTHRTEARVQTTAISEGLRTEQFQPPALRLAMSHRSTQPHKLCTTTKQVCMAFALFHFSVFIVSFVDSMSFLFKDIANKTFIFCWLL